MLCLWSMQARPLSAAQGASRDENAALLESVNCTGRAFLSHTDLSGAYTLRFAVSGAQTQVRAAGPAWVRASFA